MADVQYLVTFAVMLAVGLLIANLTTRLSAIAEVARQREGRTSTLYAMTRELTASRDAAEVAAVGVSHVHDTFVCDAAVLMPVDAAHTSSMDVLAFAGSPDWLDERERSVARWTFEHIKQAGSGTRTLLSSVGRFVPLAGSQGRIAVLALRSSEPASFLTTEQLLLLDTFANQITLALALVAPQPASDNHAQCSGQQPVSGNFCSSHVDHGAAHRDTGDCIGSGIGVGTCVCLRGGDSAPGLPRHTDRSDSRIELIHRGGDAGARLQR
ncbi:MAG: hypothetical protein SGJ11_01635 [Phycisphaerae bacterium]|nr:hypothetical protein [Phycisphaerae bacterium]